MIIGIGIDIIEIRRIKKVLENNGFNITTIPHPGHRLNNKKNIIYGSDYIDYLKRSKFVISCTTIHNISVRRYWEIAAARATPIGNTTGYPEHNLIKRNIVEINSNDEDQQIVKIVKKALENYNKYELAANNISNEIISNHNTHFIAKKLYKKLKNRKKIFENKSILFNFESESKLNFLSKKSRPIIILRSILIDINFVIKELIRYIF